MAASPAVCESGAERHPRSVGTKGPRWGRLLCFCWLKFSAVCRDSSRRNHVHRDHYATLLVVIGGIDAR